MPRVNRVKKARKDQGSCSRCNCTIKRGDGYVWWQFRFGTKNVRCSKSECFPRASELTQSEKLSRVYAQQENVEDAIAAFRDEGDLDNLNASVESAKDELQEVADEYRESADNIRENFPDSPTADECEEKAENLESVISDIEGFSPDEFDHDADDEDRDEDEQRNDWIEEVVSELEAIDISVG
jgi:hypothetical protein